LVVMAVMSGSPALVVWICIASYTPWGIKFQDLPL